MLVAQTHKGITFSKTFEGTKQSLMKYVGSHVQLSGTDKPILTDAGCMNSCGSVASVELQRPGHGHVGQPFGNKFWVGLRFMTATDEVCLENEKQVG